MDDVIHDKKEPYNAPNLQKGQGYSFFLIPCKEEISSIWWLLTSSLVVRVAKKVMKWKWPTFNFMSICFRARWSTIAMSRLHVHFGSALKHWTLRKDTFKLPHSKEEIEKKNNRVLSQGLVHCCTPLFEVFVFILDGSIFCFKVVIEWAVSLASVLKQGGYANAT
mgnify:CR=1 FL=1